MASGKSSVVAGALLAATGVAAVCATVWLRKSRRKREATDVGHISQLFIYPFKSCRGISVDSAQCTALGLQNGPLLRDRTFMIVNKNNQFINLADHPTAVLIMPSLQEDGTAIWLDAPEMETLKFSKKDLDALHDPVVHVNYNGLDMLGYDCGEIYAEWFQRYLKKPHLRVVYFGQNIPPVVSSTKKKTGPLMKDTDMATYNFTSSFSVMTEDSIDDFNTRMKEPVPMTNFRPNILVRGCKPYDEDNWMTAKPGPEVVLQTRKLLQRCNYVNVNADTGVRNPEVLKTLNKYRKCWDENLNKLTGATLSILGLNMGVEQEGKISVGDPVIVSYK